MKINKCHARQLKRKIMTSNKCHARPLKNKIKKNISAMIHHERSFKFNSNVKIWICGAHFLDLIGLHDGPSWWCGMWAHFLVVGLVEGLYLLHKHKLHKYKLIIGSDWSNRLSDFHHSPLVERNSSSNLVLEGCRGDSPKFDGVSLVQLVVQWCQ